MYPKTRYTKRSDTSSIPASFPSHGSNRPRGFPEFPARRAPCQQTPLAFFGDPPHISSQVSARSLMALAIRSLFRATALCPQRLRCQEYPLSPPPISVPSLSRSPASVFPQPWAPSLTRSPPPMMVETFPHYADLKNSGRIEEKRRERVQLRPPEI